MDWSFIWKTVLIVIIGTALIRFAGRKSVSQLTIAQTVIMISIGTLIIQPVVGKNIWFTFLIAFIMIGMLLIMEYAELKIDAMETTLTGKSKILIKNGKLNEENLRKLRMTVDQLEMKLRQRSVMKISDVKWATLEANGQLGLMLKDEAQPVTKGDLQHILKQFTQQSTSPQVNNQLTSQKDEENIFKEVDEQKHKTSPPTELE